MLDPNGPFLILNAFEAIEPGATHNIIVAFIPNKNSIFQENLIVKTKKSNLTFVLNAIGVEPSFSLSYEGNVLDFGYCLANDKMEKNIEVKFKFNLKNLFKIDISKVNLCKKKCS